VQDILSYVGQLSRWRDDTRYAADLAARVGASLTGLFVVQPIVPLPTLEAPQLVAELQEIANEDLDRSRRLAPAFEDWASALGVVKSLWQVAQGELAESIAHVSSWHDLLVLAREPDASWSRVGELGSILLRCGLPTILLPPNFDQPARFESVAIGWNGSIEATRAMHTAMPLIRRASRVTLLCGERNEPFSSVVWFPPFSIERYLAANGVQATIRSMTGQSAGRALLEGAAAVDADLLVMGAYGRARVSEWALGGATRYVLEHATLPVLMRH